MRSYIKYTVLFIILILIGIVGIHLYSNENLKEKEQKQIVNQSNAEEKEEVIKTEEEIKVVSEETTEEVSSNTTDTTSQTDNSIKTEIETAKGYIRSSVIEDTVTENKAGEGSSSSSTTNSSTTASNDGGQTSSNEVNVIDVTQENYAINNIATTDQVKTSTSNNSISTDETIILEIDDTIYQQTDTQTSTKTESSKSNQNVTNNSTDTTTSTKTESTKTESNTTNNTKTTTAAGFQTNVSFTNFDNCIQNKVIKTVKGTNGATAKIRICLSKFKINNTNTVMQNFAITDDYIYFSNPGRGAWIKTDAAYQKLGKISSLKKVSATYVVRVNKNNNTYQTIYLEYAGHAQSFDVATIGGVDQIYTNYFAKLYKESLGYGAKYTGVTAVTFKDNTNKNGSEVIPTTATSVSKDGKTLSVLKSSSYNTNGKFNSSNYYNKVMSIGSDSDKMTNPEVAIDEENNQIALVSGTTAYIYNYTDFQKGKATLVKKFTIASGKQGVELYNGYLYLWTGDTTHVLYKYKISTGKLANKISFNLYNYYGTNKGGEAEGISIYKGKVYIGIPGSKCNGNTCNDIFMVEGF